MSSVDDLGPLAARFRPAPPCANMRGCERLVPPGIFSRGERFAQDSAGVARAHQYRLPSERLSNRNRAAEWVCADHAARQHDGLRRRAHRAVGARQRNDNGECPGGTPVTIIMRKPALREAGILPKGGILRLYGRAKIHNPDRFMKRSGTVSSRRRRRAIRKRRAMPSSLRSREPRICRVSR